MLAFCNTDLASNLNLSTIVSAAALATGQVAQVDDVHSLNLQHVRDAVERGVKVLLNADNPMRLGGGIELRIVS